MSTATAGKIILSAGAPATSGDDEHRMLLAVREIMDAGAPLPIRIGVNRGSVFVGEVGPPYRRTFTAMGDAVNLAARLMAKAEPGQILSTPEVLARSRTRFDTVDLDPFYVKGKSRPVQAQVVGARMGVRAVGATQELPLLGREAETRQLAELAAAAVAGHGSVVEIVGEPGTGKSRLVSALRRDRFRPDAAHRSLRTVRLVDPVPRGPAAAAFPHGPPPRGRGQGDGGQIPRRAGAPFPGAAPVGAAHRHGSRGHRPGDPGVPGPGRRVPPTPVGRAVIELLARLLPDAGLFIIEDAHNMDEASADLFGHLAAAVGTTSWLWCMTRRDLPSGFVAPEGSSTRIELGPMAEEAALELARAATEDAPLSERELSLLVARSGGNPLFLRELIAVARSGESVDSLPESIEEVAAARIDRLPVDARRLLRRMSVLGQSFPVNLLADVVDDLPGPDDPTWRPLEEFVTWDGDGDPVLSRRPAA